MSNPIYRTKDGCPVEHMKYVNVNGSLRIIYRCTKKDGAAVYIVAPLELRPDYIAQMTMDVILDTSRAANCRTMNTYREAVEYVSRIMKPLIDDIRFNS